MMVLVMMAVAVVTSITIIYGDNCGDNYGNNEQNDGRHVGPLLKLKHLIAADAIGKRLMIL